MNIFALGFIHKRQQQSLSNYNKKLLGNLLCLTTIFQLCSEVVWQIPKIVTEFVALLIWIIAKSCNITYAEHNIARGKGDTQIHTQL